MTSRSCCRLLLALLLASFVAASARAETPEDASKRFLDLVDAGRYAESWNEAARFVRDTTEQDEWAAAMKRLREAFGVPASRSLSHKEIAFDFPDGPDGHYITLVYAASFPAQPARTEVVHLYLEADRYRVAGYGFKKD